jgi:crotonobetainyl-CoA:carnitine CoA-transferase CaiB-like acyl-CoA transferase
VDTPLSDLRIVSLEQYGAGPFGTMQLSDLGADVIKIEDPNVGGDVGRVVPPFAERGSSLFFESFNRNKKSVALDLKTEDGRRRFENLVAESDALFFNLRGDQPERLRLRHADLQSLNPRIVCVSLSGFGTSGPRKAEGAFDHTLQGLAGWMQLTGGPEEPPTKSGASLVDFCGGYVAALAILAGVWQARRTGHGCDVDLSLFEVALAQLTYHATWTMSRDFEVERVPNSRHQSIVPFQTFATANGQWIVVACPKQRLWVQLCAAIDDPDLAEDPRFGTPASRLAHRDDLIEHLTRVFVNRPAEEWLQVLVKHGVPAAPVNTIDDALHDKQALARDVISEWQHPTLGAVRVIRTPFRFSTMPHPPIHRAPLLDEHGGASLLRGDERT